MLSGVSLGRLSTFRLGRIDCSWWCASYYSYYNYSENEVLEDLSIVVAGLEADLEAARYGSAKKPYLAPLILELVNFP